MDQHVLDAQRDYWNRAFSTPGALEPARPHWVDELAKRTSLRLAGTILEIGCGQGYDTSYLLQAGSHVICLDLAWNALQQAAAISPSIQLVNAALPASLPFCSGTFDYVVAGLSLHYFRRQDTYKIVEEIGRVLLPNGILIFRVNSTEDVAHGAGRGEEIEPNLFHYQGRYKRFFTERMCRDLFDVPWEIETLMPWVETRSDSPKPTWMGVVRRA